MKVITSLAEKGGVGKTTLACILTAGLRQQGLRVLLVGLDLQNGACGVFLKDMPESSGVERMLLKGLFEPISGHLGVDVLTGGMSLDSSQIRDLDRDELQFALSKVADRYDVVVVDSPPILQHLHRMALRAADLALVITTTESKESLAGYHKVLDHIQHARERNHRVPSVVLSVVNRVRTVRLRAHEKQILDHVRGTVGEDQILEVAETAVISSAIANGHPEDALTKVHPAQETLTGFVESVVQFIRHQPAQEQAHG